MPSDEQTDKVNPLKDKNLTDNFMFVKTFSDKEIFEKTVSLLLGEDIIISNENKVSYEEDAHEKPLVDSPMEKEIDRQVHQCRQVERNCQ